MLTIKSIVKAAGSSNLALYRGDGYFYFVYDCNGRYLEHVVMVNTVNQISLESWLDEAKVILSQL
jgi:signal transduction histidine kinase